MVLALEDIRVLELSRYAPASFCTMMLADLGAQVLKVEALPDAGLPAGGSGVSFWDEGAEEKAAYQAINRNKKSIGLNLKSKEAHQIFLRLAEGADVIIEALRPGVVKRLGIDYETMSKVNPEVVYCSVTGYGQDGPYRDMPGHDLNYISIAGVLDLTGQPDSRPVIPPNLMADYAGGSLHAAIGILVALMARQKTGRGQFVDISMTDGVLSMMARMISRYYGEGVVPRRGEEGLLGALPEYNAYETKDRKYVSVACSEPRFWANLCREVGREDFIPFQHAGGDKREELFSYLRKVFLTRTRDEWFEQLRGKDIPVAKVYSLDEALIDPQLLHRQMVLELEHPTLGKVKQVGIAIKLSDTPGRVRDFAPVLGQHTDEVLADLGYDKSEIVRLRQGGVVG